jgi:preprotein translocase subunit SecE
VTTTQDERHAVSDKRDDVDSDVDDVDDIDAVDDIESVDAVSPRGNTAVVARPQRPTGKRPRREVVDADDDDAPATDAKGGSSKNGDGKKPKKVKQKSDKSRNPIAFVINYLKQVIAELRKVIWPNRKQMISYTTVVLVFLAFMVALIGGVDLGLTKLVTLVFG